MAPLDDWQANFDIAEKAHRIALYSGTISSPEVKEAAALEFIALRERFCSGSTNALAVLERELSSEDGMRRSCAVKLYLFAADIEEIHVLSSSCGESLRHRNLLTYFGGGLIVICPNGFHSWRHYLT
jgi:hypothetical protein